MFWCFGGCVKSQKGDPSGVGPAIFELKRSVRVLDSRSELAIDYRSRMADCVFNLLTLEAFTPRGMMKLSLEMMQQSAEAIRLVTPWRESRLAWREFQNKLEAFNLFAHVDAALQIPRQGEVRLQELIKKIETLGPYRAVWATEGLGYYLGLKLIDPGKGPRNLLTDQSKELSERSLAPLHSGMGLAIGKRLMETVSPGGHESEIRRVLEQFVLACRDISKTGYTGAAYESLGLVMRTLYPQMIPEADRQLREIDEDLLGYFWHGVGRGIYFAPTNFLPDGSSFERAIRMTWEHSPHELGRRNALAGMAWAMTLINLRHPEILVSFLKHHSDQLRDRDAFVNGVSSSVLIWRDSTSDDPSLRTFLNYQPDFSDETLVERWERLVHRPCVEALESMYPLLKEHQRLDEVFHYRDPPAVIQ